MGTIANGRTWTSGEKVTPAKLSVPPTLTPGTIVPADLTTGAPSWDGSGNLTAPGSITATGSASVSGAALPSPVSSLTVANGVATLVFPSSVAALLSVGDLISLSGWTGGSWNQQFQVLTVSTNTITFISVNTVNPTGGTVSKLGILTGNNQASIPFGMPKGYVAFDASIGYAAASGLSLTYVTTGGVTTVTASKTGGFNNFLSEDGNRYALQPGDWVTITAGAGATANYNGTWTVITASANAITFTVANAPSATASLPIQPVRNLGAMNVTGVKMTPAVAGQYRVLSPMITTASVVLVSGKYVPRNSNPDAGSVLVKSTDASGAPYDGSYFTAFFF